MNTMSRCILPLVALTTVASAASDGFSDDEYVPTDRDLKGVKFTLPIRKHQDNWFTFHIMEAEEVGVDVKLLLYQNRRSRTASLVTNMSVSKNKDGSGTITLQLGSLENAIMIVLGKKSSMRTMPFEKHESIGRKLKTKILNLPYCPAQNDISRTSSRINIDLEFNRNQGVKYETCHRYGKQVYWKEMPRLTSESKSAESNEKLVFQKIFELCRVLRKNADYLEKHSRDNRTHNRSYQSAMKEVLSDGARKRLDQAHSGEISEDDELFVDPSRPKQDGLPDGWSILQDPKGRWYYWYPPSYATYTRPVSQQVVTDKSLTATVSTHTLTPVPIGWERRHDHKTGEPYLYNPSTGATQWEHTVQEPSVVSEQQHLTANVSSSNPEDEDVGPKYPGWKQVHDPKEGTYWYYHVHSPETTKTWEKPKPTAETTVTLPEPVSSSTTSSSGRESPNSIPPPPASKCTSVKDYPAWKKEKQCIKGEWQWIYIHKESGHEQKVHPSDPKGCKLHKHTDGRWFTVDPDNKTAWVASRI